MISNQDVVDGSKTRLIRHLASRVVFGEVL